MNRKPDILLIIFIAFITLACNRENAAEFNDSLVFYKDKADSDFVSMNKYINIALQEKEFGMIDYITQSTVDSLSKRVNALSNIEVIPSGEEFKNATTKYIQSLINTSQAYKSYSILSDSTVSPRQLDSLRAAMKKTEMSVDTALKTMIVSQQDFARIKNLKLEPNNK